MSLICIYCESRLVRRQGGSPFQRSCMKCGRRWYPIDERRLKKENPEPSTQMEFTAMKTSTIEMDPTLLRNAPGPETRFELARKMLAKADDERREWLNKQCGIKKQERRERAALRASPPSHRTPK